MSKPSLTSLIPWMFVAIGIFFIWVGQHNSAERSKRSTENSLINQSHLRAMYCMGQHTSKPVGEREPDYVGKCKDKAEQATGIELQDYR